MAGKFLLSLSLRGSHGLPTRNPVPLILELELLDPERQITLLQEEMDTVLTVHCPYTGGCVADPLERDRRGHSLPALLDKNQT